MAVVSMLRLDYLWADRYCIPQMRRANTTRLPTWIIYTAELTVIAAAGENADYGLPGVSSP